MGAGGRRGALQHTLLGVARAAGDARRARRAAAARPPRGLHAPHPPSPPPTPPSRRQHRFVQQQVRHVPVAAAGEGEHVLRRAGGHALVVVLDPGGLAGRGRPRRLAGRVVRGGNGRRRRRTAHAT